MCGKSEIPRDGPERELTTSRSQSGLDPTQGLPVVIANHLWPGGYAGLAPHAVGAFALLTVYKIIRGATEKRDPEE